MSAHPGVVVGKKKQKNVHPWPPLSCLDLQHVAMSGPVNCHVSHGKTIHLSPVNTCSRLAVTSELGLLRSQPLDAIRSGLAASGGALAKWLSGARSLSVCEAWHRFEAPPTPSTAELNDRVCRSRVPAPEKAQGFPFHLETLTYRTTYTVKTNTGPGPGGHVKNHMCTADKCGDPVQ